MPQPIPHILHTTWKTTDIPYDTYRREWVDSWRTHHPDWAHTLWTDEQLRAVGRRYYGRYERLYQEDVPGIFLADFGRYMVLHRFGGLYVDLDYECFRCLEPLLEQREFVTSYVSDGCDELNNALMASIPGHLLLDLLLEECHARWTHQDKLGVPIRRRAAENVSGPPMLTHIAKRFVEGGGKISVEDRRVLCPLDWRKGLSVRNGVLETHSSERLRAEAPEAYAATYWTHVR